MSGTGYVARLRATHGLKQAQVAGAQGVREVRKLRRQQCKKGSGHAWARA